jgi:hypothetical protein
MRFSVNAGTCSQNTQEQQLAVLYASFPWRAFKIRKPIFDLFSNLKAE